MANLYPGVRTNTPRYWHQPPRATRVAVPAADGTLSTGFLVETWTQSTNELNHTLVSGDGAILEVESRTSADSYNVFTKNPTATPQQVIAGPGAGNAESPVGWLFAGAHGSTHISGNNANSYLDAVSNNKSDGEGDGIVDGNFLTAADLSITPSDPKNREVAVQNLFYLNNVIHDELYRHGFVEAAGNFQENNFSNGGRDGDSVNAEAQDGGGTDNANFATPPDGQNPRMQMYLWTGKGTHEVVVGGTVYRAEGAVFGPALDPTGVIGPLRLASDGTGPNVNDGCEALQGFVSGNIALLDRGTCTFTVKVKNAQLAGAVAVIIANNQGDSIFVMGGSDPSINIPSVFVSQTDGTTLKGLGTPMTIVRRKDPLPIQRDSDVDSDVVFHEYCHGLTWRMIGKMSGPVAGAIGEGMSDVCALLMNEDDVIGEYSFDDPLGIRRFPYTNYPNTYADLTGCRGPRRRRALRGDWLADVSELRRRAEERPVRLPRGGHEFHASSSDVRTDAGRNPGRDYRCRRHALARQRRVPGVGCVRALRRWCWLERHGQGKEHHRLRIDGRSSRVQSLSCTARSHRR